MKKILVIAFLINSAIFAQAKPNCHKINGTFKFEGFKENCYFHYNTEEHTIYNNGFPHNDIFFPAHSSLVIFESNCKETKITSSKNGYQGSFGLKTITFKEGKTNFKDTGFDFYHFKTKHQKDNFIISSLKKNFMSDKYKDEAEFFQNKDGNLEITFTSFWKVDALAVIRVDTQKYKLSCVLPRITK